LNNELSDRITAATSPSQNTPIVEPISRRRPPPVPVFPTSAGSSGSGQAEIETLEPTTPVPPSTTTTPVGPPTGLTVTATPPGSAPSSPSVRSAPVSPYIPDTPITPLLPSASSSGSGTPFAEAVTLQKENLELRSKLGKIVPKFKQMQVTSLHCHSFSLKPTNGNDFIDIEWMCFD
jgi:hypothetical protein